MSQLKVFVSSTCFDLSQVRANLNEFISGLGYHPILSEYPTFPIDPDDDTIENCIKNVETADLLILILGNRYGYVADSGKSITNTEYLYARQKGIPIYIFIYKPLISILPVWKKNKTGDFSDVVDSIKVFELVEEIREKNKEWCFEFEKAQDIVGTLKVQFSHMFKSSLDHRLKFKISKLPDFHKNLSAKAVNILLNKDQLFEAKFFAQVLKDELRKHEDVKLDLEYKVLTSCNRRIKDHHQLVDWLQINFETIQYQIESINNLFNQAFTDFYGEYGVASDIKGLYYVACAMARVYKQLIMWSIDIESTSVDEDYLVIKNVLAGFPESALITLWEYPNNALLAIDEAIRLYAQNKLPSQVDAVLVLTIEDSKVKSFTDEIGRLERALKETY